MTDEQKTQRLNELVRHRHDWPGRDQNDLAERWVVLDEIRNGAGFSANRSADVVACGLWPSDALPIIGYELKASRSDLKHELASPAKSAETYSFCDTLWLVVWDARMIEGLDVPPTWGIMARVVDDGEDDLKIIRKASTKHNERPALSRSVVAVLLRACVRASAGARRYAMAIQRAYSDGHHAGKSEGEVVAEAALLEILKPLEAPWREANGRTESWNGPSVTDLAHFAVRLCAESK